MSTVLARLQPWLKLACRGLVTLCFVAIYAGTLLALADIAPRHGLWSLATPGFVALLVLTLGTVAIHEGGHVIAAVAAGSTVTHCSIYYLNFIRRNGRVHVEWRRTKGTLAGYVLAVPDVSRSLRRQKLMLLAGGPLANLLTAAIAVSFLLAVGAGSPRAEIFVLAFIALNAATGFGNLLPIGKTVASDGSQFLRWWLHPELCVTPLHTVIIAGRSLRATSREELPLAELLAMQSSDSIETRFFAGYVLLRRAQQDGDAAEFGRLYQLYADAMEAATADQRRSLQPTWAYFRCEWAYALALDGKAFDACAVMATINWRQVVPYVHMRLACATALADECLELCGKNIARDEGRRRRNRRGAA